MTDNLNLKLTCIYHPENVGVVYCDNCDGYLCNGCITRVNGKYKCLKCDDDVPYEVNSHHSKSEKEYRYKQKLIKINNIVDAVNRSEISSIKNIVTSIIKIIKDPNSNAKDLTNVIQIDPPLTARVLRAANSAYYASRRLISEIDQAVIWIGYNTVKELALSQKVCEIFNKSESIDDYSRLSLWKHSVAVALFGKMLYRREFGQRGEDAYVAGLLHDIGIIAEDQFMQDDFSHILSKSKQNRINLSIAESDVLGYNHSEIGMAIIDSWHLPYDFVMAVGYHHNPFKVNRQYSRIVMTLYIADYYCQESGIGFCDAPYKDKSLFNACLNHLNLKYYALDLIMKELFNEFSKMEEQGVFDNGIY